MKLAPTVSGLVALTTISIISSIGVTAHPLPTPKKSPPYKTKYLALPEGQTAALKCTKAVPNTTLVHVDTPRTTGGWLATDQYLQYLYYQQLTESRRPMPKTPKTPRSFTTRYVTVFSDESSMRFCTDFPTIVTMDIHHPTPTQSATVPLEERYVPAVATAVAAPAAALEERSHGPVLFDPLVLGTPVDNEATPTRTRESDKPTPSKLHHQPGAVQKSWTSITAAIEHALQPLLSASKKQWSWVFKRSVTDAWGSHRKEPKIVHVDDVLDRFEGLRPKYHVPYGKGFKAGEDGVLEFVPEE